MTTSTIDAQYINDTLGGKRYGKGFIACCPAHDDSHPSLSITDGDNGKPLVHCLSGCTQDQVITALKGLNLWPTHDGQKLTQQELDAKRREANELKALREQEQAKNQALAATRAQAILEAATGDPAQHPYAIKKVVPLGDRVKRGFWKSKEWDDALLIPLYDKFLNLTTISAINTDGTKDLLAGGKKKGCFHPIGTLTGAAKILIGEGLATMAACHAATDLPCVMAVDAGNLKAVAEAIRQMAPGAEIIIIADDDQKADGSNPGKSAALSAAKAVGGKVAIPTLGKKADAWDVWNEQGLDAIKDMVEAAVVVEAEASEAKPGPEHHHGSYNLDDANDDIQRLRGALAKIPADAKVEKHTAAMIIGWGLRHSKSEIATEIGAALCEEWDKLTGGASLEVFIKSDPNYSMTKPVTKASIYDLAKKNGWDGQVPWPVPLPLVTHQQAEPYPLQALPVSIGAAVQEVVAFVQCPVALGACSALSVISTAVQGLVDVRRANKLEGPTSLFLMAVADSGERKTTADGFFSAQLQKWDAKQAEEAKPFLQKYASDSIVWEAKKSGLTTAIKEGVKHSNSTEEAEDALFELEKEKPEPPKVPRLLFGDSTPEALAYRLAHGWPVGGVLSSEAGVIIGGHAMGKDSVMRNMAMLNTLWDAKPLPIDRRSVESYTVTGARLTMGLAVQSETVRSFLDSSKGLARGIGFLARFLIAWPESTQGDRPFTESPDEWPNLDQFHNRLAEVLNRPLHYSDDGGLEPEMVELSPESKSIWIKFYNDVEAELKPGREMDETKDVASKAADNAARLAALFHCFENREGTIGADHMAGACKIASWHLYEARRFMGEIALPVEINNAKKLDGWLIGYCQENLMVAVSTKDVQRLGPHCTRKKDDLDPALDELIEACRVRVVKDGRRKLVEVNPALLGGDDHGAA